MKWKHPSLNGLPGSPSRSDNLPLHYDIPIVWLGHCSVSSHINADITMQFQSIVSSLLPLWGLCCLLQAHQRLMESWLRVPQESGYSGIQRPFAQWHWMMLFSPLPQFLFVLDDSYILEEAVKKQLMCSSEPLKGFVWFWIFIMNKTQV